MRHPLGLLERLEISLFYRLQLSRHRDSERRVGWRSRENQERRFALLAAVGDLSEGSVLDLGCGLGCLYGWLSAGGWRGDYLGVDSLGSMVREARRLHPGVKFERRDFLTDPPGGTWDWVFLCGVFNHKVRNNAAWIRRGVGEGLKLARRGLAFNLLSPSAFPKDPDFYYPEPAELLEIVESLPARRKRARVDEVLEDVTVYLYP